MKLSEIEAKVGLPFKAMRPHYGTMILRIEFLTSDKRYVAVQENVGYFGGLADDDYDDWTHVPDPKRKALAYVVAGELRWYLVEVGGSSFERAPGFDIDEVDV